MHLFFRRVGAWTALAALLLALPLAAADYKLSLAGTNVLQGKAKPGGSIPS